MDRLVMWGCGLLLVSVPVGIAEAQEQEALEGVTARVFVDCQTGGCDQDFFRTEMPYVDWMRDRQDADVHVLVTSQTTGAGGRQYSLRFFGQGPFEGEETELEASTAQDATREERRQALARVIALGLAPYLARTPVGDRLSIRYAPAGGPGGSAAAASPSDDPWNFWVLSLSGRGFFRGQSTSRSQDLNGSISANRTTAHLKVRLGVNVSYEENEFDLSDGTLTAIERNSGFNGLVAWSLGEHWAAGSQGSVTSSTFANQRLMLRWAPVVEYNLFPYSESTRRELTFSYQMGINHTDYFEETIFQKNEETIFDQTLRTTLDIKEPWGSSSLSVEGATFLDDFEKNRLTLFGNANIRLIRGLSLDLFGSYSRVRDQVFLSRAGATDEEVLLQLRQLQTSFTYFVSVGLRYSFGSIFNNVVNSRMDNIRGGTFFF